MADKERKIGPEEKLWAEVMNRAGMKPGEQAPFLALARGKDMTTVRLQQGQQVIKDSLDRLGDLLEEALKQEKE